MRWMSPHDLVMWNFRKNVFAGRSSHVDHHGLIPRLLSSSTVINNTSSANPQILQNWGNGWHPKWPGFNPDQPWSKEKCKFLHLGRITSTGYQYSEEWTGRAHSCWKWAHRGCLAESKPALHSRHRADQTHTEHYSQTSTWRAILLFSAQLWWGHIYDTVQFWHNQYKRDVEKLEVVHWRSAKLVTQRTWPTGRVEEAGPVQSGTEESKHGRSVACDCLNRVTEIMELNFLNNAKQCKKG